MAPMNARLLRPIASTGFDPRTIPGLALWLDGRFSVLNSLNPDTEATAGQTVRRWRDKSGAGITTDQGTGANQPLAVSGGGVSFDGSNDRLSISVATLVRDVSYVGVFCALRTGTVGDTARPLIFFRNNTVAARSGFSISNSTFQVSGRRLENDSFQSLGDTGAVSSDQDYIYGGIIHYGAATARVRRNGVETLSGSFQTAGNTSDTNSSESTVGAHVGVGSFWSGRIYELLLYNGDALTPGQALAVERYLGRKWGISVA